MVKNPPAYAEDTSSIPGKIPHVVRQLSHWATITETVYLRVYALQQEKWPWSEAHARQLKSSPHSLQLEKILAQQPRPRAVNKYIKCIKKKWRWKEKLFFLTLWIFRSQRKVAPSCYCWGVLAQIKPEAGIKNFKPNSTEAKGATVTIHISLIFLLSLLCVSESAEAEHKPSRTLQLCFSKTTSHFTPLSSASINIPSLLDQSR